MKIITLNVLSHQYTNFARGDKKEKESEDEMKLRYVKIYRVLLLSHADVYCLQEVDILLSKFLKVKFEKEGYNCEFVYNDPNNGLMTIWKSTYNVISKFKKNITKKYFNKDKSFPYKKQIAYFVKLNIGTNNPIMIINTRLWGHPDRIDVRKDELNTILLTIKDDGNLNTGFVICGDFNEPDYRKLDEYILKRNDIHDIGLNIYKDYFNNPSFSSSYHPWNLNRDTGEMYEEPSEHKYKTVDYFITSKNITINKCITLPTANGIAGMEEPYKNNKSTYTFDKWPSDHALFNFTISLN